MDNNTDICGTLTLVGTPIGNLGDISPRALDALRECDFIAAEDTRVTLKLLNHFDIKKPLMSYHQHNKGDSGERILERLKAGESCCLVSDAGMPAISDPGEDMVALCREHGVPVTCCPGPSAVTMALAISGLPTGRFTFEGFLSVSRPSRTEHLAQLVGERRTMVFYEAPHKLRATLRDLRDTLGADRRIAVVRELTKIHEEVVRTTIGEAYDMYRENPPLGEIVLIIEGAPKPPKETATIDEAADLARGYMADGDSASEAAKRAAKETGIKKSEIYRIITGM